MNLEEQRNDNNMGRKDWILRALLLAVTSLWPHKVDSRVGQRLSKKSFGRRGLYVSFSTAGLQPGS